MTRMNCLDQIRNTIQSNCHISDAQFAGNYTLCIYLLKMREFYRWEHQLPFGKHLSNDDTGPWLTRREALWDELEDAEYSPLTINSQPLSPFDDTAINQQLNPQGLVYSGGYGSYGKPIFFLAELVSKTSYDDYTLYVAGHELARDVTAPPGMAHDKMVFIRRESLRRFIWEKLEESHWHKQENPLARALSCYDFNSQLHESLDQMTDMEVDTVLHHEIGEIKASQIFGNDWEEMLMQMPRSQSEFMARAIKDHLADAVSTLPRLLENKEPAQLHFYFANFTGMRKVLFPSLYDAYNKWITKNSLEPIKQLIDESEKHWTDLGNQIMTLFDKQQQQSYAEMETLIKNSYL